MQDQPNIALIAAVAKGNVIGHKGAMPWHAPSDLRWFKKHTLGKVLIVGRNTWQAIDAPLKDREVIVLSRSCDDSWPNHAADLEAALKLSQEIASRLGNDEIMIARP